MSKAAVAGAEAESQPKHQQDPAQRGTLDVRTVAIQHIVERAASQVPGTVAHSAGLGKLLGKGYPSADIDVRGASTWIRLQIAVVWPTALEEVAARARDQVREHTTRLSGTDVRRVDVTVHVVAADQANDTTRRVA
ncbi:MAG: Asp23/Gls24 family envelope stress response protein [Actinomycetota bacterium]|nr:Asp23/Gls24 family envelope stress response protein [Actinomycetota bacterium]